MIREVLLDRRIEISIGTRRSRDHTDRRLLTAVFDDCLAALRIEASERRRERRAEAAVSRRRRDDFDHASQLPSVLSRISAGHDRHRTDIVRSWLGRIHWRSIVRHWQTVEDVLCLILRTAGMKDAVCLEQPAWLRIYHVGKRPARKNRGALLQRVGADAVRRGRLTRID